MQQPAVCVPALVLALALALAWPAQGGRVLQASVLPAAAFMGLSTELYYDRLALLSLKALIAPSGFGTSAIEAGWPSSTRSPSRNPCASPTAKEVDPGVLQNGSWPHIICYQKRVTQLKLTGLGISGELPAELSLMSALNAMYLGNNRFYGTIPNEWAAKRTLPALTIIRLNDNRLSGSLPAWARRGAFPALSQLYLDNNQLEGPLPTTWAGTARPLRNLDTLSLSRNFLGRATDPASGNVSYMPLPGNAADWGRSDAYLPPFPRLRFLNLDNNSFVGSLPETWGQPYAFTALKQLNLGNMGLTGALPASWGARGSFKSLVELQLQWNNLGDPDNRGGLPAAWKRAVPPRSFPSLQTLVLFNGNDNICGAPAANNTKLQGDARYVVTDAVGRIYTPSGTWRAC